MRGFRPKTFPQRLVVGFERGLTATVNDVEHIESQSLNGLGVIKIFFYPNVRIDMAMAQVTAIAQSGRPAGSPGNNSAVHPGLQRVLRARFIQLALSGKNLSEQQMNDLASNFLRTQLATVQGAVFPNPYGGKQRQIQVDLNIPALQAKGLSPTDVVNAIGTQNLILPAGTVKIGSFEDDVDLNGSPQTVEEMNDLPIKTVGHEHDLHSGCRARPRRQSSADEHRPGGRATSRAHDRPEARKHFDSGHHQQAQGAAARCPCGPAAGVSGPSRSPTNRCLSAPPSTESFGKRSLPPCLTGLMILIFLGSWRSTLIIAVSIPLSILTSIIVLSAIGQTINIMTLGGLALAVGILVDDATVEIENINRNLAQGKEIIQAILDGAQQIAVPAFVSTLSICIVFVPMFFLTGVAKYLFVPLAEAVVFAMLASYLLSRTLVPTMARYLLKAHVEESAEKSLASTNPLVRLQGHFELQFEKLRNFYRGILRICLAHRVLFPLLFLAVCVGSFALYPWLGEDFFPVRRRRANQAARSRADRHAH